MLIIRQVKGSIPFVGKYFLQILANRFFFLFLMITITIKKKSRLSLKIHKATQIPFCVVSIISKYAEETSKEQQQRQETRSQQRHVLWVTLCVVWSMMIICLGIGYPFSLPKWNEHTPLLYHEQRIIPLSKAGIAASSLLRLSYDTSLLDVYAMPSSFSSSNEYNTVLSPVIQREQIMFSDSTFQYNAELMKGSQITARTTCDVGRAAVSFCYESAGNENCQNGYGTMSWSLTSIQNNQNMYFEWKALRSSSCKKNTYCPRILPQCIIDIEYQLIQFQFPLSTHFLSLPTTIVDVSDVDSLWLRSKTNVTHAAFASRFEMALFYRPELYFGVFMISLLICGGCCSYYYVYYYYRN